MSKTKRKRKTRFGRWALWLLLVGICGWGYLSAANAEDKTAATGKTKKVATTPKPVAASPAVQKQIETQFAKMAQAMQSKNISALLQSLTSDFTQKNLDGKTADRNAARANFDAAIKAMKTLSAGFTIEKAIALKTGTEVTGKYLFAGMTAPKKSGDKSQQLALAFPIKTLWMKTKLGWRLRHMEQLKGGVVTVDGKVPEN